MELAWENDYGYSASFTCTIVDTTGISNEVLNKAVNALLDDSLKKNKCEKELCTDPDIDVPPELKEAEYPKC